MRALCHRDELIRAVMRGNATRIDQLATQLAEEEEIKRLHQAQRYCTECIGQRGTPLGSPRAARIRQCSNATHDAMMAQAAVGGIAYNC